MPAALDVLKYLQGVRLTRCSGGLSTTYLDGPTGKTSGEPWNPARPRPHGIPGEQTSLVSNPKACSRICGGAVPVPLASGRTNVVSARPASFGLELLRVRRLDYEVGLY